jgi:hypothetical protein
LSSPGIFLGCWLSEAIHEAEPRGIPLARLRRFVKPKMPDAADLGAFVELSRMRDCRSGVA